MPLEADCLFCASYMQALMKNIIAALVAILLPLLSVAQKHTAYADLGVVLNGPRAAASATYNYKLAKRLGVGIGAQGCIYAPTDVNIAQFVPGVFADVRLNIRPAKNNQFFTMLDVGMNFYKADMRYYRTNAYDVFSNRHNNGMLLGLGVGYLRRLAPRGTGVYASLKMMSNNYTTNRYDPATLQKMAVWYNSDFIFVASVGIRY